MNIPPPELLDEELLKIAEAISAPDSRAGRMMQVKRENNAKEWDDEADSQRSRQNIEEFQDNLEAAARLMASKPRP